MLTKRTNHDRRPEIFWLTMEDFCVYHRSNPGEFLPQLSIQTVLHIQAGALNPIASMPYCFASQMARWL